LHVATFLALAVGVWVVLLALRGLELSWAYMWPFGTVLTLLTLALVAWDQRVWRLAKLHGWFVRRPDLRGTWRTRLVSEWRDPETGEAPDPIECYVAVTQTFARLQLRLMSRESESWLLAGDIRESPKGSGYQVLGIYMNQPDPALRGLRSEIHFGGLVLDTHGPAHRPSSLSGEYWTDRNTKGTMELTDRADIVYTQFSTAASRMSGAG